jgi:regulatory protein
MDTATGDLDLKKAKMAVHRLLKIRLRSEHEVREKLIKKEFSDETIDKTIQYFKTNKFLDDQLFARAWIQSRLLKPFGLNRIRFELKNKGIANDILQHEISQVKENIDEPSLIETLVKKMKTKYKNIEPEKGKQRAYGYLVRRGFDGSLVMKVIRSL